MEYKTKSADQQNKTKFVDTHNRVASLQWEGEGESTKWVAGVKYMDGNRTELDFGWGSTQWSTQMLNYSLVHPLNYIMLLTNVTPISLIENKNIKTLLFGDFQSRWRHRQRWFAS